MAENRSSALAKRPWSLGLLFGIAAALLRVPFIFRYDLYFQTEGGVHYLMAKRILKGEFPTYFWESDYAGTLPHFVTAAFFALFGPSIPLASLVSVLSYAGAVALGVAYVRKVLGVREAIAAGIFAVVGVPYALKYTIVPPGSGYDFSLMFPFVFLWLATVNYQRGWSLGRCVLAGLLAGYCWYFGKQVLLSFATVGVVFVADKHGRKLLRDLVTSRWGVALAAAFVVGYLPEIVYKLSHEARRQLLGVASPEQMWKSLYWFFRVLPAYFDGDPLARLPEGVHYLLHTYSENFPQSVVDFVGIFIAWTVAIYILKRSTSAWREHNVPLLMLAAYPIINALAVIFSSVAAGEYYAPKRYLFTSGIILLFWTGIKASECWEKRQFVVLGLLAMLLPISTVHQYDLLNMPDELRDYRAVVKELRENDLHYGVTYYSYAFALTGLSDEDLIFGVLDYNKHEPYERIVAQQDTLALVYPTGRLTPPDRAAFYNKPFARAGDPHEAGELSWVVYKRAGL
jgi:hypothetical protein